MLLLSRVCPVCGTDDESSPDPLGVHRCRGCQVEFRPPIRVPIRRAGVTAVVGPGRDTRAITLTLMFVSAAIGVAIAAGDSQAPSSRPEFALDEFRVQVPTFEPVNFDALALYDPFADVALEHEVHVSVLEDGELFATGLLRNPGATKLAGVSMQVRCLDTSGALLAIHPALVACRSIEPEEVCGWSLDVRVGDASEFAFEAKATPGLLVALPTLSLRGRFDSEGAPISSLVLAGGDELEFDPAAGTLNMRVDPDATVLDGWATVTSFDAQHKVLGVAQTSGDGLLHGAERLVVPVVVARRDDAQVYEIRVGGDLVIGPLPTPAR